MNRTWKTLLWIGAVIAIPGAGVAWLVNYLATDPDREDFRRYVKQHYDRLKVEEEKWKQ